MQKWTRLAKEYVFETDWFRIAKHQVELPSGVIYDNFYVRESRDACTIFPVTKEGKIVLIREYKFGADSWILGLPAGTVEEGEIDFEEVAKRELLEETGYSSTELIHLQTCFMEPTASEGKMHYFLAKNCIKTAEQSLDLTETIEVELVTPEEFQDLLASGDIATMNSIACSFLAMRKYPEIKGII